MYDKTTPLCYNSTIEWFFMEKVDKLLNLLKLTHPDAKPELDYTNAYELLVAVILSAQCTDRRVNQVTPRLFEIYPDVVSMSKARVEDVEELIKSCGFYHNKARAIVGASQKIVSDFDSKVPSTREELMSLPGVGRKTANVVYSVAFGGDAIAVDTHVFRVSRRLGLTDKDTPEKVEEDLCRVLPKSEWSLAHHLLIFHGRRVCKSQRPLCDQCKLKEFCVYRGRQ